MSWRLLPDVGRWQEEYAEKLTIALVSRGEPEEHAISVSDCSIFNLVGRYQGSKGRPRRGFFSQIW